jgi:hypothetical protein
LQWYCAQKPTKIGRGAGSQQQQQQSQKQIVLKNFSESMTYRRQCCKILTEKVGKFFYFVNCGYHFESEIFLFV